MDIVVTDSGCDDVPRALRAIGNALVEEGTGSNINVRIIFRALMYTKEIDTCCWPICQHKVSSCIFRSLVPNTNLTHLKHAMSFSKRDRLVICNHVQCVWPFCRTSRLTFEYGKAWTRLSPLVNFSTDVQKNTLKVLLTPTRRDWLYALKCFPTLCSNWISLNIGTLTGNIFLVMLLKRFRFSGIST